MRFLWSKKFYLNLLKRPNLTKSSQSCIVTIITTLIISQPVGWL